MTTNGFSSRLGDNYAAVGLRRLTDSEDRPLWRLSFGKHPVGNDAGLIDVDASIGALIELKLFAEKAIKALQTDGGRIEPVEPVVR
jgi:hypothetical protein